MHLLVTAGPTVEDIDEVRFVSNRSSGRMGYALAEEALKRGWAVTLVSGPVCLKPPEGLKEFVSVRSTQDMHKAVSARFGGVQAVAMAAAVADYRPAEFHPGKMKKGGRLSLELIPTVDILAGLGESKEHQLLVGFALEAGGPDDEQARAEALRKVKDKNLDAVVLNGPANIGAATGRALVMSAEGETLADVSGSKEEVARAILDVIERLGADRKGAANG